MISEDLNGRMVNVIQFKNFPCDYVIQDSNHLYYVWNEFHKSKIYLMIGDFINTTNPDDIYPIKREVFLSTYKIIDES